jgi:hypothetical protein
MALVPTGRRLGLAALLVTLAAGCTGSGYSYHANKDEKLYFKVPDDWTVFDTGDLVGDPEAAGASRAWLRGFVGGERGTTDAVWSITYEQPRGFVEVRPLEVLERDEVSLATLRGLGFGSDPTTGGPVDPFTYAEQHPDELTILGYEDVALDGGAHGVHLRIAITPKGTDRHAVVDQTVLVDKATTKQYVLNLGCSETCWDAHHNEIQEVIDSWTLEAT